MGGSGIDQEVLVFLRCQLGSLGGGGGDLMSWVVNRVSSCFEHDNGGPISGPCESCWLGCESILLVSGLKDFLSVTRCGLPWLPQNDTLPLIPLIVLTGAS